MNNIFVADMVYGSWLGGIDSVASVLIDEVDENGSSSGDNPVATVSYSRDLILVAP